MLHQIFNLGLVCKMGKICITCTNFEKYMLQLWQFWHNTQRNAQPWKSWNFWVLPNYFPPTPRFSDVVWISKRIDDEKVALTTFSLFCGESFDRKEEFSSVQRRRPPSLFPRSQVLVRGKSVACFGTGEGKGPCSSSATFNHPRYILESTVCIYVGYFKWSWFFWKMLIII